MAVPRLLYRFARDGLGSTSTNTACIRSSRLAVSRSLDFHSVHQALTYFCFYDNRKYICIYIVLVFLSFRNEPQSNQFHGQQTGEAKPTRPAITTLSACKTSTRLQLLYVAQTFDQRTTTQTLKSTALSHNETPQCQPSRTRGYDNSKPQEIGKCTCRSTRLLCLIASPRENSKTHLDGNPSLPARPVCW